MIFSMRNLEKNNYKDYYRNYTANKDSGKKDKYLPLRIAIIALLPVLVCLLYALIDGHLPFKNSLQYSTWNDELFYFKQTEGILSNGFPKGFFGFNESHAKVLSFAAWSPTLILPWLALGKIFGWKLFSPFIYNGLLYCGAMLFWGIKTKPDLKKLLLVSAAFLLFPLNYRYIFSAMPEIIVWALIIVFYTLALVYTNARPGKGKTASLVTMFFLSALLTTMRPYFILLMLLPAFFLFLSYKGKKKWLAVFIDLAAALATALIYRPIKKYLSAPYFTKLYNTQWLDEFKNNGIVAGVKFFWNTLVTKNVEVYYRIKLALQHGYQSDGAFYFVYIGIIAVLILTLVLKLVTKKDKIKYLWKNYMGGCGCIIHVINISDKSRFDYYIECLNVMLDQNKNHRDAPIIIFGNKFNDKIEFEPEEILEKVNFPPEISPIIIKGNVKSGEGLTD
ncbi:MAG: hypothetical protein II741_08110, partial [Lachnospiraceae bacterium]|nr:hypothetical protein [Lachnospiraceae bacterium]